MWTEARWPLSWTGLRDRYPDLRKLSSELASNLVSDVWCWAPAIGAGDPKKKEKAMELEDFEDVTVVFDDEDDAGGILLGNNNAE